MIGSLEVEIHMSAESPLENIRRLIPDVPADLAQHLGRLIESNRRDAAWGVLASKVLTPAHDFSVHQRLYEICYGEEALLRACGPAWLPSQTIIENANLTAAAGARGVPLSSYHRFSVEHRATFWADVVERLKIQFRKPYTRILDATQPTRPRWLVDAELNIVDSCFQADAAAPAILESNDSGGMRTVSYGELRALVNRVANALVARGIRPGDTVAMIGPMTAASVAGYLGVIACGAAVVSIADSFAPEEIAARLRIANAKLVITQDVVPWAGKKIALYEKVAAATELPIVVIPTNAGDGLRSGDVSWPAFLSPDDHFVAMGCTPHAPINILFSSGTTGEPKAIPWDHTTPIKCAMDAHFHHDLHPGDVTCWPTNLGWMMGPWLIFATLINGCTMALFHQSPHDRAFGQFVQDAKVTMLGLVPSLVRAWRNSNCMKSPQPLDWSAIKCFSSSGECSSAPDMLYLMHLAGYKPIIEYCGGTEIGGAYITSTIVQPNIPGAFSTAALGIDIALVHEGRTIVASDDQGARAISGEAYLVGPSIGLSTRLLNRDQDAIYFKDTPPSPSGAPLRRHGDELERLPNGYFRIAGRSDDTMNLGGIKVSCAEIERALSAIPGVLETAAVAVPPPGGGPSQLVIFTVLKPGENLSTVETLKPLMQQAIRNQLNPLFKIEAVRIVGALPRTASNKVMRRELRKM
jgi:acetyl-CoA synthetase